jgi:hypothetical protein
MLDDLLSPDDEPEGTRYDSGRIRLASSFAVEARRFERKIERGRAQRSGVLIFGPVELLAGPGWLLTCWHPTRAFCGADQIEFPDAGLPASGLDLSEAVAKRWQFSSCETAGDLGILIMDELAVGYRAANWALGRWLQDWELSLYVEDQLDNPDELKLLWGEMAVFRDWLTALNLPDFKADPDEAWLPASHTDLVEGLDDRIDDALSRLGKLSDVMRSSFGILHVQQAEEERERRQELQERVELIAAIFLVPTLIVGFYGANTWVPGQGKHWGFWIMVAVLLICSITSVLLLLRWQREKRAAIELEAAERHRRYKHLLQQTSDQLPLG